MSQVVVQQIEPREALRLARRAASLAKTKFELDEVRRAFGKKVGQTKIAVKAVDYKSAIETALSAVREGQLERAKAFVEKADILKTEIDNIKNTISSLPERVRLSELSKRFYKLSVEVATIGQKYIPLLETPEE
ncbi:MAG: hypothetical protein QXL06_01885 [Nitrososphaerota archaeon]